MPLKAARHDLDDRSNRAAKLFLFIQGYAYQYLQINISTAEDPVEINLSGINQVQVQPKDRFWLLRCATFLLRQDPDVDGW